MDDRTHIMYDLHGYSESVAKGVVSNAIREAAAQKIGYIRFVTGRGNHENSRGERGTLFRAFPKWLEEMDYGDRVEVNPENGYYTVHIKSSKIKNHPLKQFQTEFTSKFIASNMDAIIAAADAGDPGSQLLYADCLEHGTNVAKNEKLSAVYVRKAAKVKDPAGMHQYARCWMHGIGVKQNDDKAVKWLTRAHEAGCIQSTLSMARGYAMALPGFRYDVVKAIELHKIAAAAGMTDSLRFFGAIYLSGDGVERCEKTSFKWYMDAANRDDAKAQFNVAVMYSKGQGVAKDQGKANEYFKKSALNGDSDAQYIYGQLLLQKGPAYKKEAMASIFVAAENGSEAANAFMGKLLQGDDAKVYLQRSAQAGNLLSQRRLDEMNGVAKPADDISAILEKFRILGDNEIKLMSSQPQFLLLDTVLQQGKKSERLKAFRLIEEMAEQHCANSMRRLVYYYERGDGLFKIKKNHAKVMEFLTKAVALDDPVAMVLLAQYYEKDSRRSTQEVSDLYQRASKLGYPPAYYYRGLILEQTSQLKAASICFTTAITLESDQRNIDSFIFGLLDHYPAIVELAGAALRRVQPQPKTEEKKVASRDALPTYAGLKSGFFATPVAKRQAPQPVSIPAAPPVQSSNVPEATQPETGSSSVLNILESIGSFARRFFN